MKHSLKLAALAFASLAILSNTASAAITTSTGDLIFGIYNGSTVYEADLGSLNNFGQNNTVDLGSVVNFNDLSTIFGSGLSTDSYFVAETVLTQQSSFSPNTTPAVTVHADAVAITDANLPGTYGHSGLANPAVTINSLVTQLGNANPYNPANPAAATFQETAPQGITTGNNFGIAASTDAGSSVVNVLNPFTATSNFYLLNPGSNTSNTHGTSPLLGTFSFVGGTDFTFNGVNAVSTPEPSTYALMGLGALVLVVAARRRLASNA